MKLFSVGFRPLPCGGWKYEKEVRQKNCDNCYYYRWYYDHCKKWDCKVDDRSVCNGFAERRR